MKGATLLNEENEINSQQVAEYLQQHPDFFQEHLALLEKMSIPHPSGNAVSLISKQLELYRNKHHELEKQLTSLIDIARENDTSFGRMHELMLALIESKTVEEIATNLDKVFSDCFLTDFSAIRIISDEKEFANNPFFVKTDDENLQHFSTELQSNKSKCGRPTLAQATFLFREDGSEVKSCAIVPMVFTRFKGIIAIGSRDETRFHYSKGNLFLTQMGEIIGARLMTLLARDN